MTLEITICTHAYAHSLKSLTIKISTLFAPGKCKHLKMSSLYYYPLYADLCTSVKSYALMLCKYFKPTSHY